VVWASGSVPRHNKPISLLLVPMRLTSFRARRKNGGDRMEKKGRDPGEGGGKRKTGRKSSLLDPEHNVFGDFQVLPVTLGLGPAHMSPHDTSQPQGHSKADS
jgi:hypothetical protein